jgi:carbonic anhydrase/acetyltransferase-like protein (isoleucine patch superfamily)
MAHLLWCKGEIKVRPYFNYTTPIPVAKPDRASSWHRQQRKMTPFQRPTIGLFMTIYQIGDDAPDIDASAYIAEGANLIGKVTVAANVSIWFGVTIRGDNDRITLGENTNVQESAVLHTDKGYPITIGKNVTIGHQAMLHGCNVGDGALIGIQAVILNGATIGAGCLVGAGALITEGKQFADNMLIIGSPAKAVRALTEQEIVNLQGNAASYVERGRLFKTQLKKIG